MTDTVVLKLDLKLEEMVLEGYFKILKKSTRPKFRTTNLDSKIEMAEEIVQSCIFCERKCRVNRKIGELGFCGVGYESRVASAFIHMGEEHFFIPSGTIFFSGCNSRCVYCQNWDISQYPKNGEIWTPEKIASWIEKNKEFVKNVNFVGGEPTPNLHNILKALKISKVDLPIIWNSNFYMSEKAMELLSGVVDVYLSDFKYWSNRCAMKYSSLPNYQEIVTRNHLIAANDSEIVIRHLVLPGHVECCSKPILDWIKKNLGEKVVLNVMSQYRPMYLANKYPEINRKITRGEYEEVVRYAKKIGIMNLEVQGIIW